MKSRVLSLRRKEAISQSGVTNYGSQNRRGLVAKSRIFFYRLHYVYDEIRPTHSYFAKLSQENWQNDNTGI